MPPLPVKAHSCDLDADCVGAAHLAENASQSGPPSRRIDPKRADPTHFAVCLEVGPRTLKDGAQAGPEPTSERFAVSTWRGRRAVKQDPVPNSLVTVISPPIIWHRR